MKVITLIEKLQQMDINKEVNFLKTWTDGYIKLDIDVPIERVTENDYGVEIE